MNKTLQKILGGMLLVLAFVLVIIGGWQIKQFEAIARVRYNFQSRFDVGLWRFETIERANSLMKRVNIHTIPNTTILEIGVISHDPETAAKTANNLADELIKHFNVEVLERAIPPTTALGPNRLLGATMFISGLGLSAFGIRLLTKTRSTNTAIISPPAAR